jgi:hypothetical protein
VSRALVPADEETRIATEAQKTKVDAARRAANVGNDPLALRARLAELEVENLKLQLAAAAKAPPPAPALAKK